MTAPTEKELEDFKAQFRKLSKKAKSLGLKDQDVLKLKSVQKYLPREYNLAKYICFGLLMSIAAVACIFAVGFIGVKTGIVSGRTMASLLAKYTYADLDQDRCLMMFPESMLDLFRPPTECDFCRNVSEVVRVSNLKPNDFVEKYAYSGLPVVITDATKNWTASDHFSFKFFKKVYKKGSPVLSGDGEGCQFFRYKTNFETLREVFRMPNTDIQMKGKPWYVGWSNCDAKAADVLRKYYQRPYFFPSEMESSKTDWIFMGTPGYGAQMHIDNVQQSSWQAQIRGQKLWTIVPPPECYYQCPHGTMKVIVQPGEVIILDTNRWFHQTDIVGDDMSITIGSEYD